VTKQEWYHCVMNELDPMLAEAADCTPRRSPARLRRILLAACLCLLLAGTALAAATELQYGMWVTYEHTIAGCNAVFQRKDFDIRLPDRFGAFAFDHMTKNYVVPEGTSMLLALCGKAIYEPVSVTYTAETDDAQQHLFVSIGKTDDPYWMTYFGVDPVTKDPLSTSEDTPIATMEIRGRSVRFFSVQGDPVDPSPLQYAHWQEEGRGLFFSVLLLCSDNAAAPDTLATYVEQIILSLHA